MRKVDLNVREQEKYKMIKHVVEGKYSNEKAEIRLDISRCHLNRLIVKYKNKDKQDFQHGNRKITEHQYHIYQGFCSLIMYV